MIVFTVLQFTAFSHTTVMRRKIIADLKKIFSVLTCVHYGLVAYKTFTSAFALNLETRMSKKYKEDSTLELFVKMNTSDIANVLLFISNFHGLSVDQRRCEREKRW